ncbi:MAG: phosphoglycerate dehydrogenase [Alphaproteobacteria bacterium]
MARVLISDALDPLSVEIFKKKNIEVDFKPGLKADELEKIIGNYDGLAVRSETKVTPEIIKSGSRLKVIGRAGIGVDNIDLPAATEAGIVVMNTPFGNSITTAEHTIAMMFALAREIPQANESTHQGKWEKKRFMGVELYKKVLGVIGCGNIGGIVASRALGMEMEVIAYDPFLTEERAIEVGVEKVELEDLFARSDFITIHVPKNEKTGGIINRDSIAKMKDGVRLINCARGGLVIEQDLRDALDSGKIAGAAVDVFDVEPATRNVLFGHPKLICTPHLGAATSEAQVNVALQIAEQMADYLNHGSVANALNMPSISAEDAPRLRPYMALAEQLGAFAGQITEEAIQKIDIEYQGDVALLNVKPLNSLVLASVLRPSLETVNLVSAPQMAKARGIALSEIKKQDCDFGHAAIKVSVTTSHGTRDVTGTLFGGHPRMVSIEGVAVEAAMDGHMLFIRNHDKPGMIGGIGKILGDAGMNISDFRLGRKEKAGDAVCIISLDAAVNDSVYAQIANLPQIRAAKRLSF